MSLSSLNPKPKTDEELAEEMILKELVKTAAQWSFKDVVQKEVTTKCPDDAPAVLIDN